MPLGRQAFSYVTHMFAEPDRRLPWVVVVLAVLCAASLWLRTNQIDGSLPYPRHVDESAVLKPAAHIVKTGDYHPARFVYPSLPIYLAAGGLALGFVDAAADLEVRTVQDIGNVSYPFYWAPSVVETARRLFAVLAVIALAAAGAVAFGLVQKPSAFVLAPLILTMSPYFFRMSWSYTNVDIVGTCFVTLTIAATLKGSRRPGLQWLVIVPATCAGLAASSKYIYGLVLLSVLLSILLFSERGRRIDGLAVAVLVAGLAFVATSPYAVLDLPGFLDGLAFNASHYASGHIGHESDPGFGKFAYYGGLLLDDLGIVALVAALVGLVAFALSDWRRALVLAAFPVALLALLAAQRVEFARNILPIFPIYAVLVAVGVYSVASVLKTQALARWKPTAWRVPVVASVVALPFVAVMAAPMMSFPDQVRVPRESRVDAVAWIKDNIPPAWTIIVPEELGFDGRPLAVCGYEVRTVDFKPLDSVDAIEGLFGLTGEPDAVLVPKWGADSRFSGGELVAALNQAMDDAPMRTVKSFPGRGLKINYPIPVPTGNPGFDIRVANSDLVRVGAWWIDKADELPTKGCR